MEKDNLKNHRNRCFERSDRTVRFWKFYFSLSDLFGPNAPNSRTANICFSVDPAGMSSKKFQKSLRQFSKVVSKLESTYSWSTRPQRSYYRNNDISKGNYVWGYFKFAYILSYRFSRVSEVRISSIRSKIGSRPSLGCKPFQWKNWKFRFCAHPFEFLKNSIFAWVTLGEIQWFFGFHGPPTPACQGPCSFDKGQSLVE